MKSYSLCFDSKVWLPDRHAEYAKEQTIEFVCVCALCVWVVWLLKDIQKCAYIYTHTLDTIYIQYIYICYTHMFR